MLLPLGGRPVVRLAAESLVAAGIAPLFVVVGAERAGVESALEGLPVQIVVNPNPEAGLLPERACCESPDEGEATSQIRH